jgi:predicted aspartyl protease
VIKPVLAFAVAALTLWSSTAAPAARKRPPRVAPVAMPTLPPAVIDDALAIGGDDIAARKARTRMTVEVGVNGTGPYRFVVDSGADSSVVGWRIARALQLPLGRPAILNGITASGRVERVLVDSLTLGPSTIRSLQLPALEERDLGGDGMVGIDALVEQRLMMDFEKRLITVEDATRPAARLDGEIVVTAHRRRGQLILTQVRAAGLPVEAVVDTGSEITIGNRKLRDRLVRGNKDKFVTVQVTGVTGVTVPLELVRVAELKVGSILLRNVPIAFADVPPFQVFGLKDQPSLLLGTDLLENFRRVSLDFRARKVRFQLRRCGSTGIIMSTTRDSSLTRISSGDNGAVCRRD